MSDDNGPSDLVGRIYDGALDNALWPEILEDIAADFNAVCCHIFAGDLDRDQIFFASLNNRFSIDRLEDYHSHYRHIDDRLLISLLKPAARTYADYELISPEEFVRTEFYNDFYKPHGLRWSLFGLPVREDGLTVGVSIHRSPGAEAFSRGELRRAHSLFPHFARAARLMRQTAEVGSLARASEAALDRLPVGLCILDRSGRPLFHNRAAQGMIEQADGFGISRQGPTATLRDETNRLRLAVVSAAAHGRPPAIRAAAR